MKKILVILLVAAMAFTMCACEELDKLKEVELPPLPTVEPSQEPEPSEEPEESPEPSGEPTEEVELGSRVIVAVGSKMEIHNAPDNEEQRILTFSYDVPQVHIEGNDDASSKINDHLAVLNELFYSGTGNGDGLNALLEQAIDNYSYAKDTGAEIGLEFSYSRTAAAPRADSRVTSLLLTTHSYTGGAHGSYFDRGYVYDTQTGELLTLDKLSEDYDAFCEFAVGYIAELAKKDETYPELEQLEDLNEMAAAILREGSWYFDENGLVVFTDLEEFASYAAGIIRFTIPYAELEKHIDSKWLPVQRGEGEAALEVAMQSEVPAGSVTILDKVTVAQEGEELCLKAVGTVYDVKISSVEYNNKFYETAVHWMCSYMDNCAIQLLTIVPEGMPNLLISYTTADGEMHQYVISQSEDDGKIQLSEAGSVESVG